jgi:hypothetical protein
MFDGGVIGRSVFGLQKILIWAEEITDFKNSDTQEDEKQIEDCM